MREYIHFQLKQNAFLDLVFTEFKPSLKKFQWQKNYSTHFSGLKLYAYIYLQNNKSDCSNIIQS